jgi:hypothetical protein
VDSLVLECCRVSDIRLRAPKEITVTYIGKERGPPHHVWQLESEVSVTTNEVRDVTIALLRTG